ncbi:MAG: HEAT repeat domain-containing protein [Planctomycetia bacterium]|nr:HEAT repeat domain-containing protein [Planctomycetia bacterium]
MSDPDKVNLTLFVAGVVVNVICVYVYGNLFAEPRELITRDASDLLSQCGRSPLAMLASLLVLPAIYAFRWTFGRFWTAAWNFRAWGIERIIGFWSLHFCILAALLVIEFSISGRLLTALLGLCLVPTTVLVFVVRTWMRTSAKVQAMTQNPTDVTVSAVIALGERALPVLLIVLESADNNARTAAAYAVGQIGECTRPIVDALKIATESTDSILREAAESALRGLDLHLTVA